MDLMIERTEKTTEAMGMEGRQATLYTTPAQIIIRYVMHEHYLGKTKPFSHVGG